MFCSKCGNQLPDGAAFCPQCGSKLSEELAAAPTSAEPQKSEADSAAPEKPKKKKSKKLPIILGVAAVAIAVFFFTSMGGGTNYKATVRAYTPYAQSQGIPHTCGQVFDRYLSNAVWSVRESGGGAYVEINGTAKGTDKELATTVWVETEGDGAKLKPSTLKLGEEYLTKNAFFALFVAYDQQDEDLSHFDELMDEVNLALGQSKLTGTFFDPATGVSFCYPDGWATLDTNEYVIANLYSPRNTANHRAIFEVGMTGDFYDVFSEDEAAVRDAVNSAGDYTFLDYGDAILGDIPAKALRCQKKGLNGDEIEVSFWYTDGEEVYKVSCTYSDLPSASAIYEPIFQAILESYSVW